MDAGYFWTAGKNKHTKLALTSIHELRQQGGFILIWARKDYKT